MRLVISVLKVLGVGGLAGRVSGARSMARAAGDWRGGALLVVICAAVYLPGLTTIAAVDRDEARFAQASRQMFEAAALPREQLHPKLHGGGWVVPRLGEVERLNKPPLIYYMQVASAWVFTGGDPWRDAIWMYRVPSVIAALVTVLITWRLGTRMFEARTGWLAAAVLAVCPMVVWDAHQARADQVLVAFTVGAQACLWVMVGGGSGAGRAGGESVWRGLLAGVGVRKRQGGEPVGSEGSASLGWCLLFWLCIAGGLMTKGPITLLVSGLTVIALSWWVRSWKWTRGLRPILGLIVLFAAAAPWLWALAARQGGLGPYLSGVWQEFFVRGATGSKEGHFWPPGFHLLLLAVLFWPGSLTTLGAIGWAWRRAGLGRDGAVQGWWARVKGLLAARVRPGKGVTPELFLLAWVVPAWIVFELSPAKLPHYTMPLYAALAILSARALVSAINSDRPGVAGGVVWWLIGMVVMMPVACLCLLVGSSAFSTTSDEVAAFWLAILAVGAVVFAGVVLGGVLVKRRRPARAMLPMMLAWVLVAGLLMFMVAPEFAPGRNSAWVGAVIDKVDPKRSRPAAGTGTTDSFRYAMRGRFVRISESGGGAWLAENPTGLLVVRYGDQPTSTRVLESDRIAGWSVVERAK